MIFLRQSTASQEVLVGPFLDDTDGKTAETGLTIANTDIKVFKAGATSEVSKNSDGGTHVAGGRYSIVMDATDSDTVGSGELNIHVSGALPVRREFCVLSAAVFDWLFGAAAPSTHTAAAVQALVAAGTVAGVAGNVTGSVGSVASGVALAASQPNYAPAKAGDAMTLTSGERTAVANEVEAQIIDDTDSEKVLQAITDKIASVYPSFAGLTLAAIAAAVRDVSNASPSANSLGAALNAVKAKTDQLAFTAAGKVDVTVAGYATGQDPATLLDSRLDAVDAALATIDGRVDTEVAAIKLVTDRLGTAIEQDGGVWRLTANALELAPAGGGGGGLDAYAKAFCYGNVDVGLDGSLTFRDVDTPATKRLKFSAVDSPGGRTVTKDPA